MFKFNRIIKIILPICLSVGLVSISFDKNQHHSTSYWLWAGLTQTDAPSDSQFYVYQGDIITKDSSSKTSFKLLGLYPHPIKCKKLYLVYRLEGSIPSAKQVVAIFQETLRGWRRHNVDITGLQLDFDSPTSKLVLYSDFLKEIRHHLPRNYALSITALGDWIIYGNKIIMKSISSQTDEIVFQLYYGRSALPNIQYYLKSLEKYPLPFKVGLLHSDLSKNYLNALTKNNNYKGVIYFIQKAL